MSLSTGHARSFSLRLSLFFAALFVVYGIQLPFFPVWLDWRGLSAAEIGVVTAAPLFLRLLVGPAAAFLADRSGDRRRAVVIASACGFAAVLALSRSHALPVILLFTAVFLVGAQTTGPIGEAIALSGVRETGADYGRMRLWGSLSFVAATFAGGALVGQLGAPSVIWMLAASMGALLAAAWLLPPPRPAGEGTAPDGPRGRLTPGQVMQVAGSGDFLLFVLAAGLVQSSHAVFYAFGVLHWQAQGISSTTIGVLWSIGVLFEVMLFAGAGRLVHSVGPLGFILAGGVAAVVRWGAMAFDPPLAVLLPLQALHALTFGATHLGAMHYIHRTVPLEQAGTAQALLAAVTGGIGMGAATLLAGLLYGPFGGSSYLAMAAIAGAGTAAALILKRR
ncbi:MAG: MFS transporter [Hyphomicrobiaceae bacterium]|nr:MFS transporter [Hyphomicrobiaceae bacterium]